MKCEKLEHIRPIPRELHGHTPSTAFRHLPLRRKDVSRKPCSAWSLVAILSRVLSALLILTANLSTQIALSGFSCCSFVDLK